MGNRPMPLASGTTRTHVVGWLFDGTHFAQRGGSHTPAWLVPWVVHEEELNYYSTAIGLVQRPHGKAHVSILGWVDVVEPGQ